MITISLNQIKAHDPCESGWKKLLASKGGKSADMERQFPVVDIITSNGLYDALWALRCLPEHSNLWRKLAVSYARDVQHLMTDQRSINALDVAWRHSEGLATDDELKAAARAAWAAARAMWAVARVARAAANATAEDAARIAARAAVWGAARDAARQKQQARLVLILTAGEWVEVGNE